MPAHWKFNAARPGDRLRESQVEKFFDSQDDHATSLIREGIQNSLDADPDDRTIRVRITLGRLTASQTKTVWARYASDLQPHVEALGGKLPEAPGRNEAMRFLVFEDFETSGLKGDPGQWQYIENQDPPNGFFGFFRAEGVSNKEGNSRGRHGVGKFVFLGASRVRTIFGLTRRDDGRELLMGTTVLKHHHVGDNHFMPDGWYGAEDPWQRDNVLPVVDPAELDRFKADFRLSRGPGQSGLSVVVPWLDDDITRDKVIRAVVEGYFFPLMENGLVCEIVDESGDLETISHSTIRDVVARQRSKDGGESFVKAVTPRIDLASAALDSPEPIRLNPPTATPSPQWGDECFPDGSLDSIYRKLSAGELLAIQCPTRVKRKRDESRSSEFTIYMVKDFEANDCDIRYIRQGILVSEVKSPRIPGLRGLVVVRDGPLATFLGDAENPAHTQWQSKRVRAEYSYHSATISYVTSSIEAIHCRVRARDNVPDPLPLKDLFFLPSDEPETTAKRKATKSKPGAEPAPAFVPPPVKPKSYSLTKVEGGFILRRGNAKGPRPASLELLMAYDTHKGNPFKKYHPADFQLDRGGIVVEACGVDIKEYDDNRIKADVLDDAFEIQVSGFDPNRDVIVKATARTTGGRDDEDDETDEESTDAAAV